MSKGTHEYRPDPRNREILIYVNGEHVPREEARVSVFDSGFVLGDGIWEGLRVYHGRIAFLDAHLDRLYEGAKALDLDVGLDRPALTGALYETLRINGMSEDVHIRLMVSRGVKATPYQDPRVTVGPATIVIIPEYKVPDPAVAARGIRLFTVHVRRGPADVQDPKLNSHSKLNCILACIQATKAGGGRGADARPPGVRRDLQLHPLLHREKGRGLDFVRRLLPRGHHPGERRPALPGERDHRARAQLQPHRRLRGRTSPSSPAPSPASPRSPRSTAAPSARARAGR